MNVIELSGLTKSFGDRMAVNNLELCVEEGAVFGLLGRNGAGKSTTIKMMLGLISPQTGKVRLMNHDLYAEHNLALEHVGALVERPSFYGYLTGRLNLRLLARQSGADFDRRAEEYAERLGIQGRLDDKVATYSQGMRQKLGIVLAMLPDSKIVVLDEPTNGLDPQGIREVRHFIAELAQTGDVTIFLSSHLLSEVEQICTSLAVLDRGETVARGSLFELLKQDLTLIEIKVDDLIRGEQIVAALDGCEVASTDDHLYVHLKSIQPAEVNRKLVEAGIGVSELREVNRTLEDYFLHLTGEISGG